MTMKYNTEIDYLQKFNRAISSTGLGYHEIIPDSDFHRFACKCSPRRNNGWYIFYPGEFPGGAFGCWRCTPKLTWSAGKTETLSDVDRVKYRKKIQLEKAKRERERREKYRQAAVRAKHIWRDSIPAPDRFPYLLAKGIQPHGIRYTETPQSGFYRVTPPYLLIPVYNAHSGEFQSLQSIDADGTKAYFTGGKTKAGYFPIGELKDVLYIAEGFATAATIFELTGQATTVAFNDSNLIRVAKAMRKKYPDKEIIIAGDNDWQTEQKIGRNPGIEAAIKAAKAANAKYCIPEFERTVHE